MKEEEKIVTSGSAIKILIPGGEGSFDFFLSGQEPMIFTQDLKEIKIFDPGEVNLEFIRISISNRFPFAVVIIVPVTVTRTISTRITIDRLQKENSDV